MKKFIFIALALISGTVFSETKLSLNCGDYDFKIEKNTVHEYRFLGNNMLEKNKAGKTENPDAVVMLDEKDKLKIVWWLNSRDNIVVTSIDKKTLVASKYLLVLNKTTGEYLENPKYKQGQTTQCYTL